MREDSIDSLVTREALERLVGGLQPEYFLSKRWFGSKSRTIRNCLLVDVAVLREAPDPLALLMLEIHYATGDPELYQLPLAFKTLKGVPEAITSQPKGEGVAGVVQTSLGELWAYDAFAEDAVCVALYQSMYDGAAFQARGGEVVCQHTPEGMDTREVRSVRRIAGEQSNTSIVYNDQFIMKAFRKLWAGRNPDMEIPYYLTTHHDFRYVPRVAGFIEYRPEHGDGRGTRTENEGEHEERTMSVAVLQDFVDNQGDGYTNALDRAHAYFAEVARLVNTQPRQTADARAARALDFAGALPGEARRLGYITGLMHNALAAPTELPEFRPELITAQDATRWEEDIAGLIATVLRGARDRIDNLPAPERDLLRPVADSEALFLDMVGGLRVLEREGCYRTRCHGDYHLGQVLKTGDDYMLLDFEGEPARTLAERRAKRSPLRDVAGMLRSFNYAAYAALLDVWEERRSDEAERAELEGWALAWEEVARTAFLRGYIEATRRHDGSRFMPLDDATFHQVVRIFEVEKAFYELEYEFNNRPTWIAVPASGLSHILQTETNARSAGA